MPGLPRGDAGDWPIVTGDRHILTDACAANSNGMAGREGPKTGQRVQSVLSEHQAIRKQKAFRSHCHPPTHPGSCILGLLDALWSQARCIRAPLQPSLRVPGALAMPQQGEAQGGGGCRGRPGGLHDGASPGPDPLREIFLVSLFKPTPIYFVSSAMPRRAVRITHTSLRADNTGMAHPPGISY